MTFSGSLMSEQLGQQREVQSFSRLFPLQSKTRLYDMFMDYKTGRKEKRKRTRQLR